MKQTNQAEFTKKTEQSQSARESTEHRARASSVREALATSHLANGTQHKPECDSGPEPAVFKDTTSALKVEHMSAVQLREDKESNVKNLKWNSLAFT